jgi:glycosyltransferase involved in cell wall biosynthesis
MSKVKTTFVRVFILVHDGVFNSTSGAGNSNARFIKTFLKLYPKTPLILSPIRAKRNGPFFNEKYYSKLKSELDRSGVKFHPLSNGTKGVHNFGKLANWKKVTENALKLINRYSKVHQEKSLVISIDTPFIGLITALSGRKDIFHVHIPRSTSIIQKDKGTSRLSWEKTGFKKSNLSENTYLGATSKYMMRHLEEEYQIQKKKILPVYNGVLLNTHKRLSKRKIEMIEKRLGIPSGTKYIMAYGRGVEYKGFHLILEALNRMKPETRPYFFIIAAEFFPGTDYIKRLRSLVAEYGLKGVLSTKFDLETPRILQQSNDLVSVIVPSIEEPFGLIPIEVFANPYCLAPVISSDAGGLKEQVRQNKTGILFRSNRIEDLHKALLKVQRFDTGSRRKMKKNAERLLRSEYDYEKNIIKFFMNVEKLS